MQPINPTSSHWEVVRRINRENPELCSLEKFRETYNVSLKQIAKITGAPYSSVRKWVSVTGRKPTLEQSKRLTEVFNLWQQIDKKRI